MKDKIVLGVGILLIALGVALNQWTVTFLLTYDDSLATPSKILVWLCDLLAIAAGIAVIYYRKNIAPYMVITRRGVLAGVVIVVVLVAGLEVAARTIDRLQGYKFTEEIRKERPEFVPYRTFGFELYPPHDGFEPEIILSSHGEEFPFKKEPGTIRIVVFGGSTTYQAVDGVHYPLALQRRLEGRYPNRKFEVINVANSAYATPHALILLTLDVLSWDPDIVILSHNSNDLSVSYFPDFAPNYENKYGHEFYVRGRNVTHPIAKLYEWSTLYWIFDQQLKALSWKRTLGGELYLRKSYGSEPPELSQDVFRRNLTEFVDLAHKFGIQVILGTQPLEPSFEAFDLQMRWKPYNNVIVYPLHEEFVSHHNRFNEIIREVARTEGAYLVDNARSFNGDPQYFSDFLHYKKPGIDKLADNYFNTIVSRGLVR